MCEPPLATLWELENLYDTEGLWKLLELLEAKLCLQDEADREYQHEQDVKRKNQEAQTRGR